MASADGPPSDTMWYHNVESASRPSLARPAVFEAEDREPGDGVVLQMAIPEITQDLLGRYRNVAVATVYSGVRERGYEPCFMKGVRPFTPGARLAGRARTLRFVPPRPDIQDDNPGGEESPEYQAMGSCGPGDVLVCDAMGKRYAAIGGDVKMLQLKMVGAEGVVTDGGIRDLDVVKGYGLKVFASGRTPMGGGDEIVPFQANVTIQCAGVAVRPGDVVVGDDDGVVVVAGAIAQEVIGWVEEHERAEEQVKALIEKEKVAPGKYYNAETFQRLTRDLRQ